MKSTTPGRLLAELVSVVIGENARPPESRLGRFALLLDA